MIVYAALQDAFVPNKKNNNKMKITKKARQCKKSIVEIFAVRKRLTEYLSRS